MAHVEGGSKEWGSLRGLRIDDCGRRELALCMLLSDPLLNFLEDVSHVEGQMVRRCRHHRDLCPALRELPLKDGQRQLGSDFGLPGEDRDHSRFKASFGLPHEALEGLVRFAAPAHPVREGNQRTRPAVAGICLEAPPPVLPGSRFLTSAASRPGNSWRSWPPSPALPSAVRRRFHMMQYVTPR